MATRKKRTAKKNDTKSFRHLDMHTVNAGSGTDCTGLMPFAVQTKAQEESYEELYDYKAEIHPHL